MDIRAATPGDIPAILDIARSTQWDKTDYLHKQVCDGNVLIASDREASVAFIVWNREFFSLPFVWLVVVSPRYRRQGIASILFDAVESRCRETRLYSSTNRSHISMQRFLTRRGYRASGEIDLDPGDPEVFYVLDAAKT